MKVTCDGTPTTILSVIEEKTKNKRAFKTKYSCDCRDCNGCKYETFVFLGAKGVEDFCLTPKYFVA